MKKVSVLIVQKILNENNFSIELAKILDIQQQSVLGLAKAQSASATSGMRYNVFPYAHLFVFFFIIMVILFLTKLCLKLFAKA